MAIRVCIAGATGWAGSMVTRTILGAGEFQLVGAIARQKVGQDIGEVLGLPKANISIIQTLEEILHTIFCRSR
jgi:4-hydroxy-tetrahydrodipicolinate reductase